MKIKKFKGISMMLAAAALSAALGGALMNTATVAADEATTAATYALTDVFAVNDSNSGDNKTTIAAGTADGWTSTTAFVLANGGSVKMKSPIAFAWYEAVEGKGQAKYFSLKFAFGDLNFKSVTMTMESPSAWATKDDKMTNKITFTVKEGKVYAQVNEQKEVEVSVTAGATQVLSFAPGSADVDGEFAVKLNTTDIGKVENVGANVSEYSNGVMHPLTVSAVTENSAKTTVYIKEVNGQSFDQLTSDGKVTDNAMPVLVVNEPIDGFLLGTTFSLDYEVVDVLKTKNLASPTFKYYQFNPADAVADRKCETTLTTSTYFMDTVYYVDASGAALKEAGESTTKKSVFTTEEYKDADGNGREFVSVEVSVTDGSLDGTYDLSWFATTDAVWEKDGLSYIVVDKNTRGPEYKHLEAKDGENKFDEENYNVTYKQFKDALASAAENVYAGSNSYIYLPSFKWFIGDNNGYRNLKFTISYKTPSSSSASTSSNLSYNALKLSVSEEGLYEFKVFANDKAGNAMMYYDENGKLVSVTSSNVWSIDEIPAFQFLIANRGLKVEDPSKATNRKDTEIIDQTYTLDDITVVGATNLQKDYVLYKIDVDAYNKTATEKITESLLSDITYEELGLAVGSKTATNKDYFALYLDVYVDLLAERLGVSTDDGKAAIKACFTQIKAYDSRITEENAPEEWEAYNKYRWDPDAQSFKTIEGAEGAKAYYMIMADYWEEELPAQRATAYKLITVESSADTISGPSEWLKNNVVSVVLFSIAGVMLILIIILLLVKPSDETLEDVDAAAEKAKKNKKKKAE